MAITVKHSKVSTIPDDADTSLVRPSDWNADHTLVGLGTMAEQNANNVNITGGSITGVTGVGTVTSVGLSAPSIFTVGGSPVTSSGTLALTYSGTALPIANGGTGATTRQDAIDALAGAVTSGQYLRGNGTDVVMSAIQAADVPTLNQNTTGTASNVTGTVVVANGGTGATTLTGLVVGNGTSAMTTVTAPSGTVVGTTDTQTLTNKRVNPRAVAAGATSGTITPNGDTTDVFNAYGLTGAITVATPSGTPVDGQRLMLRFEDNGTGRGITWTGTSGAYRAVGVTLPTTTVASKVTYVGCVYNSNDIFWDAIAVATQA